MKQIEITTNINCNFNLKQLRCLLFKAFLSWFCSFRSRHVGYFAVPNHRMEARAGKKTLKMKIPPLSFKGFPFGSWWITKDDIFLGIFQRFLGILKGIWPLMNWRWETFQNSTQMEQFPRPSYCWNPPEMYETLRCYHSRSNSKMWSKPSPTSCGW